MSAVAPSLRHAVLTAGLALGFAAWLHAQEDASEDAAVPAGDGTDEAAEVAAAEAGTVTVLRLQGAIGPATADFVTRGVEAARENNSALMVIEMDTPGGLDTAMRDIIQSILGSPVPVATYVWPQGARAASAGTYILYASHIAAMAPATNLGAATPVSIGGVAPAAPGEPADEEEGADDAEEPADATQADDAESEDAADAEDEPAIPQPSTAMERKAINDAVAYIRSLAELRGRNADWAEAAVRAAESLSAQDALDMNVIDVIANNRADLLQQLDGRELEVNGSDVKLNTAGLTVELFEPDWRTRLLAVISNPTVAYLLMLIGIYGLIFEGYNPGAIVPGVVGAISLLLALFAFQVLPVNYAGLALILLGVILMVAEFLVPSFGALGMGGIASFVFGSVILIDADVPGFGVSMPLIFSIALTGALTLLGIVWFAMKSRDRPVVSGVEEMVGAAGEALQDFTTRGQVWVHNERWSARTSTPIRKGQAIRVKQIDGLTLHVEPGDESQS